MTTPVRTDHSVHVQPLVRRVAATLLIGAGLLLIAATYWSVLSLADDLALEIEVAPPGTTDDDARFLFPVILLTALALMLGGAALAAPDRRGTSFRRQGLGATVAVVGTALATVALRALTRAKDLIDDHVAVHGPLPDELYALGGSNAATPAEALLADRLCVADGLYPFGVLALLAPIALAAIGVLQLSWSRRATQLIISAAVIAIVVAAVLYGPTGSAVVNILE